jgi:hypothetical protein
MAAGPDPMGKRALFWMPVDEQVVVRRSEEHPAGSTVRNPPVASPVTTGGRRARPAGRRAFFSVATPSGDDEPAGRAAASADPLPARGSLTVDCSACGSVTRIGLLDFVLLQLPIGAWVPGRTFDHRMRCPSCRHRAWTSVTISR